MSHPLRENTLRYDPDRCVGCGACSAVCPHGVFSQNGGVAELSSPEACMECGACQLNCPSGAILVDSGVGCAYLMMKQALLGEKNTTACSC
jgi:NAD-dependent dihydropyrimidine dehydrogenase PreA subunit